MRVCLMFQRRFERRADALVAAALFFHYELLMPAYAALRHARFTGRFDGTTVDPYIRLNNQRYRERWLCCDAAYAAYADVYAAERCASRRYGAMRLYMPYADAAPRLICLRMFTPTPTYATCRDTLLSRLRLRYAHDTPLYARHYLFSRLSAHVATLAAACRV